MSRVTQKGQVTIPAAVRKMLDVKTGDEVVFEVKQGDVILSKRTPPSDAFRKYVGFLSHLKGEESDGIVDRLRGRADDFGG
jgi:AbrB family looped-hinge helix DNA binding protein